MIRTLGNALLFQLGWWVAILSAGRGQRWLAPLVLALLIAVNIWNASQPRAMTLVVLAIGSAGLLLDSGLTALGLLRFGAYPFASWLCALWYLFATTLHQSLRWLEGRTWLAALNWWDCRALQLRGRRSLGSPYVGTGSQQRPPVAGVGVGGTLAALRSYSRATLRRCSWQPSGLKPRAVFDFLNSVQSAAVESNGRAPRGRMEQSFKGV